MLAERFFWDEFGVRFNFIAVDYLGYTREVVGNIRESFPVGTLLGTLGIATPVHQPDTLTARAIDAYQETARRVRDGLLQHVKSSCRTT